MLALIHGQNQFFKIPGKDTPSRNSSISDVKIEERVIAQLQTETTVCVLSNGNTVSLSIIPGIRILNNTELLSKLSELFSTNYGIWSSKGLRPRQPVIMTVKLMRQLLLFDAETTGVVIATSMNEPSEILGGAFYYKFISEMLGKVCWITQLVTHQGNNLCLLCLLFSFENFSCFNN